MLACLVTGLVLLTRLLQNCSTGVCRECERERHAVAVHHLGGHPAKLSTRWPSLLNASLAAPTGVDFGQYRVRPNNVKCVQCILNCVSCQKRIYRLSSPAGTAPWCPAVQHDACVLVCIHAVALIAVLVMSSKSPCSGRNLHKVSLVDYHKCSNYAIAKRI